MKSRNVTWYISCDTKRSKANDRSINGNEGKNPDLKKTVC